MNAWAGEIAFLFLHLSGLQVLLALNVQCDFTSYLLQKILCATRGAAQPVSGKEKKNAVKSAGLLTAGQKGGQT